MKYIHIAVFTRLVVIGLLFSCSDKAEGLIEPELRSEPFGPNDISITAVKDSTGANGTSYAEVLLKVSPRLLEKSKDASFEISPIGNFSNGTQLYKTVINTNGEARAFASSNAEGISQIKATVGGNVVTQMVKFGKITTNVSLDTLILEVGKDSVAADDYSYAEVVATTKHPGTISSRIVKFTTDKGTFSDGSKEYTINFGMDSIARAFIKHTRAEPVRITATVNNSFSKELFVHFKTSWPDQILIEPSVSSVPPLLTSKATVTARLLRPEGSVSEGHIVTFYDSTTTNKSVGTFLNTTKSNNSGEATTQYWLQDTTYKGFVYIKGYIQTDTGKIIGVNRILIQ